MRKSYKSPLMVVVLAAALLISLSIVPAATVQAASNIQIVVYGKTLYSDVPPTIVNSRTFVPMSPIFTALDAQVSWDPVYQEVLGRRGTDVIVLQIGNPLVAINGEVKEMDVAPFIDSGRTMVPAAFIALALGETVDWNAANRTVYIGPSGDSSAFFTEQEAIYRVIYVADLPDSVKYLVDSTERRDGHDYYIIKAYEEIDDGGGMSHTSTIGWYYVEMNTGDVFEWDMTDDSLHFLG
ncbi:MAG: copper amine oxidase N-terminal domain-containing protein [Syntrophomonas sp.]